MPASDDEPGPTDAELARRFRKALAHAWLFERTPTRMEALLWLFAEHPTPQKLVPWDEPVGIYDNPADAMLSVAGRASHPNHPNDFDQPVWRDLARDLEARRALLLTQILVLLAAETPDDPTPATGDLRDRLERAISFFADSDKDPIRVGDRVVARHLIALAPGDMRAELKRMEEPDVSDLSWDEREAFYDHRDALRLQACHAGLEAGIGQIRGQNDSSPRRDRIRSLLETLRQTAAKIAEQRIAEAQDSLRSPP